MSTPTSPIDQTEQPEETVVNVLECYYPHTKAFFKPSENSLPEGFNGDVVRTKFETMKQCIDTLARKSWPAWKKALTDSEGNYVLDRIGCLKSECGGSTGFVIPEVKDVKSNDCDVCRYVPNAVMEKLTKDLIEQKVNLDDAPHIKNWEPTVAPQVQPEKNGWELYTGPKLHILYKAAAAAGTKRKANADVGSDKSVAELVEEQFAKRQAIVPMQERPLVGEGVNVLTETTRQQMMEDHRSVGELKIQLEMEKQQHQLTDDRASRLKLKSDTLVASNRKLEAQVEKLQSQLKQATKGASKK